TRDRNGIHGGLCGPFKEGVAATEFDDLLARHCFSSGSHSARDATQITLVLQPGLRAKRAVSEFVLATRASFQSLKLDELPTSQQRQHHSVNLKISKPSNRLSNPGD